MEHVQQNVAHILQLLQNPTSNISLPGTSPAVLNRHIINGCNVMTMYTRDRYSFGLDLMDMLFTTEELSGSLVYQPKPSQSSRKRLDKVRASNLVAYIFTTAVYCIHVVSILVDQMMDLIRERFPILYKIKLIAKFNQKCRDKEKHLHHLPLIDGQRTNENSRSLRKCILVSK